MTNNDSIKQLTAYLHQLIRGNWQAELALASSADPAAVAALKKAVEKLRHAHLAETENARKWRAVTENTSDGNTVILLDEHGNVEYVNSTGRKVLSALTDDIRKSDPGFRPWDLIGTGINQWCVDTEHRPDQLSRITDRHVYTAHLAPDFVVLGQITPISGTDGTHVGYVVEWFTPVSHLNNQNT